MKSQGWRKQGYRSARLTKDEAALLLADELAQSQVQRARRKELAIEQARRPPRVWATGTRVRLARWSGSAAHASGAE